MSQNLVDLHCHILPGIDDGAKNLDVSMALLSKEIRDGVAGIVFTPHFHYERISVEDFAAKRKAAFLKVAKAARENGLPLAAKMGAEVYFTTALPSLDLSVLAFAKSNYILIEFPTTCHPAGIDETLYGVRQRGYCNAVALVTGQNKESCAFHKALGFKKIGVEPRTGYKFGQWLDLAYWWMDLRPGQEPPEPVRLGR